jgi:hypothetical protein
MLIRRDETSAFVGANVRAAAIFRCCIKKQKRNGNEWLHWSNEIWMELFRLIRLLPSWQSDKNGVIDTFVNALRPRASRKRNFSIGPAT